MDGNYVLQLSGLIKLPEQIQFYFDENVDQRLIAALRDQGITVKIPEELGMKGEEDDIAHLVRATEIGCVLVTGDRDFEALHKEICELWLENSDVHHNGIILLVNRIPPPSPGTTIKKLVEIYETLRPGDFLNTLRYV